MQLTVVTTLKPGNPIPFLNALGSWRALGSEVLVLGDCQESNEYKSISINPGPCGLVYLDDVLTKSKEMMTGEWLVLAADHLIILGGLVEAVNLASSHFSEFVITGRRLELEVEDRIDYSTNWRASLGLRLNQARLGSPVAKDYFILPKALNLPMPPFLLGREWWDTWLVWAAGKAGIPVIDVTELIRVVHQAHGWPSPGGCIDRAADLGGVHNSKLFWFLVEKLSPGVGSVLKVPYEVIRDGQGNWVLSNRE